MRNFTSLGIDADRLTRPRIAAHALLAFRFHELAQPRIRELARLPRLLGRHLRQRVRERLNLLRLRFWLLGESTLTERI